MSNRIFVPESEGFSDVRRHLLRPTVTKTVFRLPAHLKRAMDIRVVEDCYGLRGKSRWIIRAACEFINPDTWPESTPNAWKRIVIDTELIRSPTIKEGISLEEKLRIRFWQAALDAMIYGANQEDPIYLELNVSSILRAAIDWKLQTD